MALGRPKGWSYSSQLRFGRTAGGSHAGTFRPALTGYPAQGPLRQFQGNPVAWLDVDFAVTYGASDTRVRLIRPLDGGDRKLLRRVVATTKHALRTFRLATFCLCP